MRGSSLFLSFLDELARYGMIASFSMLIWYWMEILFTILSKKEFCMSSVSFCKSRLWRKKRLKILLVIVELVFKFEQMNFILLKSSIKKKKEKKKTLNF